mgnify:FL=1
MKNFIFENKTRVYFGKGCVQEFLASLLNGYQTVMFAYGCGSIKKNGIYDQILYILQREGKNIVEFSGIKPGPTYEKVLEGIRLAREKKAELILAVGGGSVMDCCKAVSLGAVYGGDLWRDFWERNGIVDFSPIPLGVVVTTGGSGSECNGVSILTNEKTRIKKGQNYEKCSPGFALIDPSYTFSESKQQMISGAVAALSHVMEIYFSQPDEDNVSDDIAEALMKSLIRNMRNAWKAPQDYEAKSNLLWASAMAKNRVIKAGKRGDFLCCQIEQELEAYTGCPHGLDCAILRPAYYRRICKEHPDQFGRFAVNVWGIPADGKTKTELAREGVEAFADFIREFGLPQRLQELGLENTAVIKRIAGECASSAGSYRGLERREIEALLRECC